MILKKSTTGLFILLFLTQFAARADRYAQQTELDSQGRPLWENGVIWVKVKPQPPVIDSRQTLQRFHIQSLDDKLQRFDIQQITRSFNPRPHPDKSGLPDLSRIFILRLPPNANVKNILKTLNLDPNVEYAERIPAVYLQAVPNDEFYDSLMYHLPQIHAEEAWDIHKGENGIRELVVGIGDSGVDWKHPDLGANIYNNLGEDVDGDGQTLIWNGTEWIMDPDDLNGLDDDHNGYVDDLIGWNFMADAAGNQNNDPMDPPTRGHGSHVAGLAAGVTNNATGIASISWNVKILPTSHSYEADGGEYISWAYSGLVYLADNGADIINASWGGGGYSQGAEEVIRYVRAVGAILVAAAGNDDDGSGGMTGFGDFYPASYPGCISVAAVDRDDNKAWYSNFGWAVDLAAPGGNHSPGLISTVPYGDGYASYSGTSMASPVAAGLFALLKSYHPDWTNDQLINQIIGTTDDISLNNPLYENWLGSGRINAYRALSEENVPPPDKLEMLLWEVAHSNPDATDWAMEPGDSTDLSFVLRNYSHGLGDPAALFTLATDDPDILISNANIQAAIVPDDYSTIGEFNINIAKGANTESSPLWLIIKPQSAEVVSGDSIRLDLLVNTTSLSTSFLDLELQAGEIDTSIVTITNTGSEPVPIGAMARSVDPGSLLWHVSGHRSFDGASWWCGSEDLGGYPDATVQYLDLPVIDLSSSTNPELNFMLDWYIEDPAGAEPPYDGWDGANVWISTDRGVSFTVIDPVTPAYTSTALYSWGDYWNIGQVPGWAGNNNGYVQARFDLNDYAADSVIIRFGFASDGAANDLGVFIDQIQVKDDSYVLFENSGVLEGGIQLDGTSAETIPATWLEFPNVSSPVPGNGSLDLEIVTNTSGLQPGFYASTVSVLLGELTLGQFDVNLNLLGSSLTRDDQRWTLPFDFALEQNFPNPFNPTTTILYALPEVSDVRLTIFDITGREIKTLVSTSQAAGWYMVQWDGMSRAGLPVAAGVYIARIQAKAAVTGATGAFSKVIKMVYLR